jgi:hypothetical protein
MINKLQKLKDEMIDDLSKTHTWADHYMKHNDRIGGAMESGKMKVLDKYIPLLVQIINEEPAKDLPEGEWKSLPQFKKPPPFG